MYEVFEEICEEREISLYGVAKGAGIDKQILSNWKHGRSIPNFVNMAKIAKFLGISLDVFAREVI